MILRIHHAYLYDIRKNDKVYTLYMGSKTIKIVFLRNAMIKFVLKKFSNKKQEKKKKFGAMYLKYELKS